MTIPLFIAKEDILRALEANNWFVQNAANDLHVSRDLLSRRMKEYEITPIRFRGEKSTVNLIQCKNHKSFKKAYNTYNGIKKRCYSPKEPCYHRYGGRGIKICDEWIISFDRFFTDTICLENAYIGAFEIDRIDNDGDYCLENIRFTTHKKNCNNTSKNKIITINNQSMTLSEWSNLSHIDSKTIVDRINLLGWEPEKAIFTKPLIINRKRTKNRRYEITKGCETFIISNLKNFCIEKQLSYANFLKILSGIKQNSEWNINIIEY